MNALSYMITEVVAALRDQELSVYLDLAPQGIPYPFCVVNVISSSTTYSLGKIGSRISEYRVQITCYTDQPAGTAPLLVADNKVDLALEGMTTYESGTTAIMGTFLIASVGPRWLGSEHVWSVSRDYRILVNQATLQAGSPYGSDPDSYSSSSSDSSASSSALLVLSSSSSVSSASSESSSVSSQSSQSSASSLTSQSSGSSSSSQSNSSQSANSSSLSSGPAVVQIWWSTTSGTPDPTGSDYAEFGTYNEQPVYRRKSDNAWYIWYEGVSGWMVTEGVGVYGVHSWRSTTPFMQSNYASDYLENPDPDITVDFLM